MKHTIGDSLKDRVVHVAIAMYIIGWCAGAMFAWPF